MDVNYLKLNARKGTYLVLFTALVSGFSIFINSFGVQGFDSSVYTFSKNIVVAVMLFGIILGAGVLPRLRKLTARHWKQLAAIGLIGGSIPFLLFFKGLQMTTGTTSAFIHKTLFIWVPVFALMFLKEKLTKRLAIAAALLLAGNFLMLRPDFGLSTGHLLIVAATVLWAAENTLAKYVLRELNGTIVAWGRMFFGSAFILLFLALTGKTGLISSMSSAQYLWILVTAVFLLLYVISYYNGLKHIKVTTAACILSLGSPITTLLSFIFKGSAISANQAIGILLIAAGIMALFLYGRIVGFVFRAIGVTHHARHHARL